MMPCATANCKKSVKKFSQRSLRVVDAMRIDRVLIAPIIAQTRESPGV
jgi:hypothetical protein